MPGDLGELAVNTRVHTYDQYARTRLRVHWAPGIPHALTWAEKIYAPLGRIAPREGESVSDDERERRTTTAVITRESG